MVGFRLFRLFLILASFPAFLGFLALGLSDRWIEQQATHWLYDRVEDLPEADVALVLGCAKTLSNGRSNLYFQYRIDAAAEAFTKGKCRYLIVSGDNSIQSYNEPDLMKEALILRGVPEDRIVCDYAGLRTLDSVVRANKIFGQRALLVISQQFHNERAIYIARQSGIEMIGLNAEDVSRHRGIRTKAREKFARVKTLLDVHLFHTQPRHLGDPIKITSGNNGKRPEQ
ncbi:MAG: YdcF family protein [Verrucomicrobiales bacterium]|nr:YdcF family protein [Verrucomicrobiales bacterium]